MDEIKARKLQIGDKLNWLKSNQSCEVIKHISDDGKFPGVMVEWDDTDQSWLEYNKMEHYEKIGE